MSVLAATGLARHYAIGGETIRALDGVDFVIEAGEFVAITGASGSGKSTLMNLLGCLDSPSAGSLRLEDAEVGHLGEDELAAIRNRRIGFVFQSFHLLPRQTALENVALPLLYAGDPAALEEAAKALATVGLADRTGHRPTELSGGQRQRVAIARALVTRPALLLADEPTGNLDSKTGEEILRILEDLNRQGITIVLVTHDPGVAERAARVIRMKDGLVVQDQRRAGAPPPTPPPAGSPGAATREGSGKRGIPLATTFRLALASLLESKLRSALSVLGVVIGVAAVIAMLALGEGAKASVSDAIGALGTNFLSVSPGMDRQRHVRQNQAETLTLEDAQALVEECAYVAELAPESSGAAQVKYLDQNTLANVTGSTPEFQRVRSYTLADGRFFEESEVRTARKVAVLGATTAGLLFGGAPAVGERIRVKGQPFEVIGVFEPKGTGGFRDPDDLIVVPLETAMKKLFGTRSLRSIGISVHRREEMAAATEDIDRILRLRHRIAPGADPDFSVRSQEELLKTFGGVTDTFTMLLAGIAAVSLLVGGIGIMNIMLVSVTERIREIGVRKALGARRRDILDQFLGESMAISLTGGAAGILAGVLGAWTLGAASGWAIRIPAYAVPLAFGFATLIGIFFGAYPAARAADLEPVEALRHE